MTWFQQDGATPYTTNASLAACKELFPGRVISRRGDIQWPPRSPDLSQLDFFFWGYLKERVYSDNPNTLDKLKQNNTQEIAAIPKAMLERVIGCLTNRLLECKRRKGGHLEDVIFHKL